MERELLGERLAPLVENAAWATRGAAGDGLSPVVAVRARAVVTARAEQGMRMSGRRHGWRTVAGAALVIATGVGGSEAVMATDFVLAITGAEGARYTGRCTLTMAAGEETIELSGIVPHRQELTGEALACRIEAAGLIAVEITHGASVSRSITNSGIIHIAVH